MDKPQAFWDAYRKRLSTSLSSHKRGSSIAQWTELMIGTGVKACEDFMAQQNRHYVRIGREGPSSISPLRFDAYVAEIGTGKLIVAFESELARYGTTGKDQD